MISPFPYYNKEEEKLEDGLIFPIHNFCKNVFNEKCKQHYSDCKNESGPKKCPYGFATMIEGKEYQNKTFFTSLNIEKVSDKKKLKKKIKSHEFSFAISLKKIWEIIEANKRWIAQQAYSNNRVKAINTKEKTVSDKKEILDDTLHELRRINKQLKKQAFFLDKELEAERVDINSIRNKSRNILSSAQLTSVRLNAYDFTLNPDLVETGIKTKVNLYKKFEKARYCLSFNSEEKSQKIIFNGTSHLEIETYEIIDILPYILFENAIKYSPPSSIVSCDFIVQNHELISISVTNKGPLLSKEECEKVLTKGYRGILVRDTVKGTGKGLAIANMICDFNNLELNIECQRINDEIGEFTATIIF
jgi:K+-sensing histidine kinase KdpD